MSNLIQFLLTLLIITAGWGCSQNIDESASSAAEAKARMEPAEHKKIEIAEVTYSPSIPILQLAAKVDFGEDHYSKISSPLSGRVAEVKAKLGKKVNAGDTLLVIDSPEISDVYSKFVEQTSQLEFAKISYDRVKYLHGELILPQKDVRLAKNELVKAIAQYKKTKSRLLALKVSASELSKSLDQQKITSRFEIKSPLSGNVVHRNVTPGQVVEKDAPVVLVTIADLDRLQVEADVYERDISLVKPNQEASVIVPAYPDEQFPAVISVVGDMVDPETRTVKIRGWVQNTRHKLKPEMYAELHVKVSDSQHFLVIPEEAVLDVDGQQYVYVLDDKEEFKKRKVEIAFVPPGKVRVLEGLLPTEKIVVKGAIFIKAQENEEEGVQEENEDDVETAASISENAEQLQKI